MRKSAIFLMVWTLGISSMWAAIPTGYYSRAEGKNKSELLSALYGIITNHTNIGYSSVWTAFKTTDTESDGKTIIDMYSTAKYTYGTDQAGDFNAIGQKYNREHSFPNSWFGGSSSTAMYSDLFHLYPTDGRVNGQRDNYIYGVCEGGTRLSSATVVAKGRLGNSTYTYNGKAAYNGKVFEPDDEYKGDFARTYFYMATCYNNVIGGWSSTYSSTYVDDIVDNNRYPVYKEWYVAMLLEWHRLDPVSEKEIKRNEAVYALQKNRNPYIDHPELVEYVWGNKMDAQWSESGTPAAVLVSPQDGESVNVGSITEGESVSKTIAVKGANLTKALSVTVSGTGFRVNKTSIAATDANVGTTVTVTYSSAVAASASGILKISSSEVNASVNLSATATAAPVEAVTALDATNVGFTSFTANWTSAQNVQSYTLYVNSASVTPPAAALLLDEDMSDGKTSWTAGGYTYGDSDAFRLGTGSGSGSIISPSVNLAASGGVVTVKVTARAYGSDTGVQMKVSALGSDGSVKDSKTFTLTSADAEYVAVMQCDAASGCKVKIESLVTKKRVQLVRAQVYSGNAAASAASAETGNATSRTISGITDTHYTVTGLTDGGEFTYNVKAVYSGNRESAASNDVGVKLSVAPASRAVADIVANSTVSDKVLVTNGDLMCVYVSPDGKTIYAKDDNAYAAKDAIGEGEVDFVKMYTNFMAGATYDQSNWVTITLPTSVSFDDYVGRSLSGVEGEVVNVQNPAIAAFHAPVAGELKGYKNNVYIAANFGGTQNANHTNANGQYNSYFLVSPKSNEIATIHWAMYVGDGKFTTPPSYGVSNPAGLTGAFTTDLSLLTSQFEFVENNVYKFDALITKQVGASGMSQKAASANAYLVYPFAGCEWEGSVEDGLITGVADLATGRKVKSVVYHNTAGVASQSPFEGVNIVVRIFTDGFRSVEKMLW